MTAAEEKLKELTSWMLGKKSVITAWSGGVDSTVLAVIGAKTLGAKALACVGDSASLSRGDRQLCTRLALRHNINVRYVATEELLSSEYAANNNDRCFWCKSTLFEALEKIRLKEGFQTILDGTNIDDLQDNRPGRKAAENLNIESPFLACNINKKTLRQIAHLLELENADKPEAACLASRLSPGEVVSAEKLALVEKAEDFLHSLGFAQVRVRLTQNQARIETLPQDMEKLFSLRTEINSEFKKIGFSRASIDLSPYSRGMGN